ncbi:hypothetical protein [Salinibius halmophilus]|uniref:hypothetical protein n=1 Tax=Salinibius halmophilus TaxID=1853216 RepID=UPI000E65FF74|nr:hypothetical protein [Salinibius halmophilus]
MKSILQLSLRSLWLAPVILAINYGLLMWVATYNHAGAFYGFADVLLVFWLLQNLVLSQFFARSRLWLLRQTLPNSPWLIVMLQGVLIGLTCQLLPSLLVVAEFPRSQSYDFAVLSLFWLIGLSGYSIGLLYHLDKSRTRWLLVLAGITIALYIANMTWYVSLAISLLAMLTVLPVIALALAKPIAAILKTAALVFSFTLPFIVTANVQFSHPEDQWLFTGSATRTYFDSARDNINTVRISAVGESKKHIRYSEIATSLPGLQVRDQIAYQAALEPLLKFYNLVPSEKTLLAKDSDALRYNPVNKNVYAGRWDLLTDYWSDNQWQKIQPWLGQLWHHNGDLYIYQLTYSNWIVVSGNSAYQVYMRASSLEEAPPEPILNDIELHHGNSMVMDLSQEQPTNFVWFYKNGELFIVTSDRGDRLQNLGAMAQPTSFAYSRYSSGTANLHFTTATNAYTVDLNQNPLALDNAGVVQPVEWHQFQAALDNELKAGGLALLISSLIAVAISIRRRKAVLVGSMLLGVPFLLMHAREQQYEY